MKTLAISPEAILETLEILKHGGVVAYPADTCFGLAADMRNKDAVEKVIAIKGREGQKPLSVMFSNLEQLEGYVMLNSLSKKCIQKLLPGPYTLVLPKGPKVPAWYFSEVDSLGIRIPNHALSLELTTRFDGPLITTSANLAGEALTFSHPEAMEAFRSIAIQPDLVLEGVVQNHGGASTVLEIKDDTVRILREGVMKKEEIQRRLESIVL